MAIDVGTARIGVARADPDGMLAVPVETVPRSARATRRIGELIDEYEPIEVLVGLPISLNGSDTASTADARAFAGALADHVSVPIRMVDERLSTVSAHQALRASGRSQRRSRSMVDQVAAVVFLQHAIDTEKRTGHPPGVPYASEGQE